MYITRAEWGARPGTAGPGPLVPARVEGIALHWPAMAAPLKTVDAVKAGLRGWQNYHMNSNGWSDIAYQEAVDQAGNAYELRGLRIQSGANGDEDVNERFGALLLVLAPGEQPSPEMVKTVRVRIAHHCKLFPNSKRIVGHQDVRPEPTECPGPAAMAAIRAGRFNPQDEAARKRARKLRKRRTRAEARLADLTTRRSTLTEKIDKVRERLKRLG